MKIYHVVNGDLVGYDARAEKAAPDSTSVWELVSVVEYAVADALHAIIEKARYQSVARQGCCTKHLRHCHSVIWR